MRPRSSIPIHHSLPKGMGFEFGQFRLIQANGFHDLRSLFIGRLGWRHAMTRAPRKRLPPNAHELKARVKFLELLLNHAEFLPTVPETRPATDEPWNRCAPSNSG
jgi:hypothetical protein